MTVNGKKQEETPEVLAGDICAVTKLDASTGDTLCDASDLTALAPMEFPKACYYRTVKLAANGDEGKLSTAIRRLLEEDRTLEYVHNHETHERIIGGLGEAVCSALAENCPVPVKRIGVNDEFGHSGPAKDLLKQFGLSAENIVNVTKDFIK